MLFAQAVEDLEKIVAALKGSHRFPVALISHRLDYSLFVTLLTGPKGFDGRVGNLTHFVTGGFSSDQPSPVTAPSSDINCCIAGTSASPPLRSR